ncbi:4-hydroxy-3-methylbut-2-enyl diphosphate reductase [Anaerobranca californiensis DSM 14826]|uniref:4-hydroxy-3-methylbut-2-enyl diphosphate reductase n=1 Tax=Anaerobranca californiensis DSM 14826 TaxID=1120989 RepID=A0A1M6N6R5_9FIRM|nr:4-hydroxy-3-methylbut-2-enyl diphosphate reductase [Anaerobranca californiensis]SHJ91401.1 4-hydroxy-3-methylbut-2-enyl diphosphate reductase [Anaerobranca californiensis DSM 14826]
MQIIIAKHSGFCKGVQGVVELVESHISPNTITYGPIVHNNSVVNYFKEKGVEYIDTQDEEQLRKIKGKRIIIRAHGVPPRTIKVLAENNQIIDGTCPFVKKVQKLAKEGIDKGRNLLILGEKEHPEIIGINGWAENKGMIIKDLQQLKSIKFNFPLTVVAQTTFKGEQFTEIVNYLLENYPGEDIEVHNTICGATHQRQKAVMDLAKEVDLCLVIGGKNSSNTRKLTSICQEIGVVTYQIEEAHQIDPRWLKNVNKLGIIGGASTPDWTIREVLSMVNEMNEMLNEQHNGEGQGVNGAWQRIEEAHQKGEIITGIVKEVVKGGLLIDLGVEAFMPASLLDTKYIEDLNQFVGQELKFFVKELDKEKNKVILSRKDVLIKEQQEKEQQILHNLKEGQKVKGIVRRMTDFGVFVDLGGIDGLIHISNLAWEKVDDPSTVLEIGQEVEAVVLKVDTEKRKVSLSLKATQPSPFEVHAKNLKKGDIVTGKVVRLADFGAFVQIAPNVDGLVHVSQISDEHIKKPGDVLTVGQEVKVKVLDVDVKAKKISLSIKDAKPKEDFTKYEQNDNLNVTLGERFGDLFKKED